MESHQSSAKHKKLLSTTVNTAEKRQQTFIPILKKNFKSKLVEAFLTADISLFKLQHPQIPQLFIHLGQPVPSESSCREHVDKLAVDEKQRLKERLHNKNTFLVVDESEINGSKYLNILIGDTAVLVTTYVLDCSIVETVNQQVVTVKINDALKKLDIQRHNCVLLSDAARYMTACTTALKLLYPRLFHITCMAHLLHNCAENVLCDITNDFCPVLEDLHVLRFPSSQSTSATAIHAYLHVHLPTQTSCATIACDTSLAIKLYAFLLLCCCFIVSYRITKIFNLEYYHLLRIIFLCGVLFIMAIKQALRLQVSFIWWASRPNGSFNAGGCRPLV